MRFPMPIGKTVNPPRLWTDCTGIWRRYDGAALNLRLGPISQAVNDALAGRYRLLTPGLSAIVFWVFTEALLLHRASGERALIIGLIVSHNTRTGTKTPYVPGSRYSLSIFRSTRATRSRRCMAGSLTTLRQTKPGCEPGADVDAVANLILETVVPDRFPSAMCKWARLTPTTPCVCMCRPTVLGFVAALLGKALSRRGADPVRSNVIVTAGALLVLRPLVSASYKSFYTAGEWGAFALFVAAIICGDIARASSGPNWRKGLAKYRYTSPSFRPHRRVAKFHYYACNSTY